MEGDLQLLERRYQQLTATIRAWGEAESEVLAILILGSRAGKPACGLNRDDWNNAECMTTANSRSSQREDRSHSAPFRTSAKVRYVKSRLNRQRGGGQRPQRRRHGLASAGRSASRRPPR